MVPNAVPFFMNENSERIPHKPQLLLSKCYPYFNSFSSFNTSCTCSVSGSTSALERVILHIYGQIADALTAQSFWSCVYFPGVSHLSLHRGFSGLLSIHCKLGYRYSYHRGSASSSHLDIPTSIRLLNLCGTRGCSRPTLWMNC